MDKFNNSNSTLALQKFYNQQNNVKLFELQQRLKTEQIVCQIEMKKLINEKKVINEEQVFNEEEIINEEPGLPTVSSDTMQVINEEKVINEEEVINEEKVIIEEKVINEEQVIIEEQQEQEQNQQEPLNGESLGEIYYRSNENFEIDKPISLERTKSTIINQTKINNLIKLKKW